jgi:hypothetical protein
MQNEDGTLFCERCKSDLLNIPEQSPMSSSVQEGIETLQANEVPMAEPVISDTAPHAPFSGSTVEHKPMEDTAVSQMVATTPKLVVIRGQRINAEYPIYTGDNFVGRTDEKPVDIDLEDQEASDRIWCSRQHAKIVSDQAGLSIEDLGSQNGTFVNRARIYPGQVRPLANGDVVQIGTVQLRVKT